MSNIILPIDTAIVLKEMAVDAIDSAERESMYGVQKWRNALKVLDNKLVSKDSWFEGQCISCIWAKPCNRKHEMTCSNPKAITQGLNNVRGWGGGEPKMQVHKLFGCNQWKGINEKR